MNDKIRKEGEEMLKKLYEHMGKDLLNFLNGLPGEKMKNL